MLPRFGPGAVDGTVPRSRKVKTSNFDLYHDIDLIRKLELKLQISGLLLHLLVVF